MPPSLQLRDSASYGEPAESRSLAMKAIVIREFGAPSVMKLEDLPDPVPGAGQVLIRVGAAGVNPVDTYIRSGVYARKPALPHTPGMDIGGTVEAVGSGVTRVKPGDRVYAFLVTGGYAQLTLAEESQVRVLPPERRSSRAPRSACPMRRRGSRSSAARRRGRAKRCWSMAPAAASASPPCRSRARTACTSSAPLAPTKGSRQCARQAPTSRSITGRPATRSDSVS